MCVRVHVSTGPSWARRPLPSPWAAQHGAGLHLGGQQWCKGAGLHQRTAPAGRHEPGNLPLLHPQRYMHMQYNNYDNPDDTVNYTFLWALIFGIHNLEFSIISDTELPHPTSWINPRLFPGYILITKSRNTSTTLPRLEAALLIFHKLWWFIEGNYMSTLWHTFSSKAFSPLLVDSNETLYGGDPKFLSEINKLCETLIGQILDHLKALGRDEVRHKYVALLFLLCIF